MPLQSWIFITILSLISQSINCENRTDNEFFPSTLSKITQNTFPVNLTCKSKCDFIIVKCPHFNYHHDNKNDSFNINAYLINLQLTTSIGYHLFRWIPVKKKSSQFTDITCGRVNIFNSNKTFNWSYKINWDYKKDSKDLIIRTKIFDTVNRTHKNCNNNTKDVLIFGTENSNTIVKIDPSEKEKVYPLKKFYYFVIPKKTDRVIIGEPCVILEAYYDCPEIKLPNHKIINIKYHNTISINIVKVNEGNTSIHVQLILGRNLEYYNGGRINFSRMRYLEDGLQIIENSSKTITSQFNITGYDIVQLIYNCPFKNRIEKISQVYYFGPGTKVYKYKKTNILYVREENYNQPNCTINEMTFGYLELIKYNKNKFWFKNLNNNNRKISMFKRRGNYMLFNDKTNFNTTLKCIYRTPGGIMNVKLKFILGIKKFIGYDSTGKKLYKIDINPDNKENVDENVSFYKKLTDKYGIFQTHLIILLIISIPLILIFSITCFYYSVLRPWYLKKKLITKYPNVYKFWFFISNESFEKYCQHIINKVYIPKNLKNHKLDKIIEGGEEIDSDKNGLFDDSLVMCYKNLDRKINAHYVYEDSKNRIYLLSDAPTQNTENSFWKMIYEEDIGTIVAIIYDKKTDIYGGMSDKVYWTDNEHEYGNILLKHVKKTKINNLYAYSHIFEMTYKKGKCKPLKILHVYNWIENDIPQCDLQIINLYKEISSVGRSRHILVNSSDGSSSSVYMFIYTVCIYDAMITYKHVDNPFNVIKKIREQYYGGYISTYEFAYVIKVVIKMFFKNDILYDLSNRHFDFIKNYDKYLYNFYTREAKMDDELNEFLMFVNILDPGKMKEIECKFNSYGKMNINEIKENCKLFLKVVESRCVKKVRHLDIECIDSSAVIIQGKSNDDVDGFIHANKFIYETCDNKERKLILCQAPLIDTIDDMIDMIFRHKVSIVVILVRPDESNINISKWIPYFPVSDEIFHTKNYIVTRTKFKDIDNNMISESEYTVNNVHDELFNFTIIHYQGWPDRDIPYDHKNIYQLYKRIISIDTDNFIAIHCSGGVGRTGVLGLIIYLIDTINVFPTFDPIARLRHLRYHRYKSVQTYSQFVFGLLVVFEHFKKKIDDMDSNAYNNFYKMAQKIFIRENGKKK